MKKHLVFILFDCTYSLDNIQINMNIDNIVKRNISNLQAYIFDVSELHLLFDLNLMNLLMYYLQQNQAGYRSAIIKLIS